MPVASINTKQDAKDFPRDNRWFIPHTKFSRPTQKFYRLPKKYSFDLDRMLAEVKKHEENYGFRSYSLNKDGTKRRKTYRAMGLSCRKDAIDPIYDCLSIFRDNNTACDVIDYFDKTTDNDLFEDHFCEKTPLWSDYIAEVLDRFTSPFTKARFIEMKPRGCITSHLDFPHYQQIKLHSYLSTNENVWIEVDGERFQIPADGNFYWFDTGKYHAVWNDGNTPRIDLNINLKIYFDRNGKQRFSPDRDLIDILENETI